MPGKESRKISASDFKARCSRVIDEIAKGGGSVVITRRGKPVAMLVPVESKRFTSLFGFSRGSIKVFGDIVSPIEVKWEAAR
jgi:prevent-host-death family protein